MSHRATAEWTSKTSPQSRDRDSWYSISGLAGKAAGDRQDRVQEGTRQGRKKIKVKRYWRWLLVGYEQGPGIRKFLDVWLLLHLAAGVILAYIVQVELAEAAKTILLPLAGVLVGLMFAWGGNAQAVLASDEFDDIASRHPGGVEEYAFTFQSAILCLLTTLALWGLAA
jgi:hypothetical protein